jgi:hypothetical protein
MKQNGLHWVPPDFSRYLNPSIFLHSLSLALSFCLSFYITYLSISYFLFVFLHYISLYLLLSVCLSTFSLSISYFLFVFLYSLSISYFLFVFLTRILAPAFSPNTLFRTKVRKYIHICICTYICMYRYTYIHSYSHKYSHNYIHTNVVQNRVARWFIFKPKSQFWVNFGWSWNGKCWYILWPVGMFNGHILWLLGIFRVRLVHF